MAMAQDPQRAGGVLPPPPSHPDDGPTALEFPPLQPPPRSLVVAARRSRGIPVRSWLLAAALFVTGTILTYYLAR
jgi:hypothetical protein